MDFKKNYNTSGKQLSSVDGWDPTTQKYIDLDCDQWIGKHRIREIGRENGKREFPPSEAVQPDEMYTMIRRWVNKRGKNCHSEVSSYLVQQRFNLEQESKEGVAPVQHKVEGLRDEGIVELTDQGQEDRTILTQIEREASEAWAALEAFQQRANLESVASYDERGTWYWWLVGVIAIEAVANAMMLAGVVEYGPLGALTVMLAIGVVNAGALGAAIGEGWRLKNSIRPSKALSGWATVVSGVAGMVLWNLFVGHFRDSMAAVATRAREGASSLADLLADDSVERLLSAPFGLESAFSWILATVGAGCCVFAATKWLARDDPYPGYGAVHRAATEHNQEYAHQIEQRRKGLTSIYKTYIGKIRDRREQVENSKGNHQLITNTVENIVKQFPMQLRQYQDDLDFIIAAYRSENEKHRTTPSPKFFADRPLIDQSILEAPEWKGLPPPNHDNDWDGFQKAEDAVRSAYLRAQAGYPTLEDLLEGESARQRLSQ
ncbi:MAG: DUF456 domain-containing protein [Gammaproteobacteria bacterium]|nr:DUF456 domain-containing protein [Gammaproteobacteria bacterium]